MRWPTLVLLIGVSQIRRELIAVHYPAPEGFSSIAAEDIDKFYGEDRYEDLERDGPDRLTKQKRRATYHPSKLLFCLLEQSVLSLSSLHAKPCAQPQ